MSTNSLFASASGSVGIRFTWSGSNQPAVSWLAVSSVAQWHSDYGRGDVANGYGDPTVLSGTTDGVAKGARVFRVRSGTSTLTKTVGGLNAYATVSSTTGAQMNASTSVTVAGFVTDKSASLARPDGGDITIADVVSPEPQNRYVANTLLSWDNADGVDPGPTNHSLTGAYGGFWSQLSNGTTDNVNITWSGASPGGGLGFSPIVGQDHHTTTYPATATGGKMPLADGSGSPKTQDWQYVVRDNVDGTEVDLTCHWICHYAYENFQEATANDRNGPASQDYTVALSRDNPTGDAPIYAATLSWTTGFSATSSSNIPGFAAAAKHVGIPAFLARAGHTTEYLWGDGASAQNWSEIFGNGNYGIRKRLKYKAHVGTVKAWNVLGQSETQTLEYDLDSEAYLVEEAIYPDPRM